MERRMVIVEDQKIFRDLLRLLFEREGKFKVVGEAETGLKALALVNELKPEIVLIDISMPEMNGIEATRHLTSVPYPPKVVALSMHDDKQFITDMFAAGACGYVIKDCPIPELLVAVDTVVSGKKYLSPKLCDALIDQLTDSTTGRTEKTSPLSPREKEVLQLLAEGFTTKEIAKKLSISAKTIESHRSQIMSKLSIYSVAGLTRYAIKNGLSSL